MLIGQTYQSIRIGILAMYLVIILPLPFVLLDHELGLLTGDPTHTTLDDHAWLDHAAGIGMASGDAVASVINLVLLIVPRVEIFHQSVEVVPSSIRGPPILIS